MAKSTSPRAINARLDHDSRDALDALRATLGWSESEIIRAALIKFAAQYPAKKKREFIGAGNFSSGLKDLATNKRHLDGFGS